MRRLDRFLPLALVPFVLFLGPPRAVAGDPAVGVVLPMRGGQARRPEPVVIVPLDGRREEPLPAPILVPDAAAPGTTTVRPEFGGGYSVESQGNTTTVRPLFGGGYTIQEKGRTTTVLTPEFGGGYKAQTTPGSPPLVLPPPRQSPGRPR